MRARTTSATTPNDVARSRWSGSSAAMGRAYPRRGAPRRRPRRPLLVALLPGCGGSDRRRAAGLRRGRAAGGRAGHALRTGRGRRPGAHLRKRRRPGRGLPRLAPSTTTGRAPGVVFLHGAGGDRSEQLGTAVKLARRGATALTITVPSAGKTRPRESTSEELVRWQGRTVAADVVAARRAFDLLTEDERVDAERLGLVGWSLGGRLGALVAGVDDRVRAIVLVSAGAAPVEAYVEGAPAGAPGRRPRGARADRPAHADRRRAGRLLVQAGRGDSIVPRGALEAVIAAAPAGTKVEWYPTDHALDAIRPRPTGSPGSRTSSGWRLARASAGPRGYSAASGRSRSRGTGDGRRKSTPSERAGSRRSTASGRSPSVAPSSPPASDPSDADPVVDERVGARHAGAQAVAGSRAAKIDAGADVEQHHAEPRAELREEEAARARPCSRPAPRAARGGAARGTPRSRATSVGPMPIRASRGAAITEPTSPPTAPAPSTSPSVPGATPSVAGRVEDEERPEDEVEEVDRRRREQRRRGRSASRRSSGGPP